MRITGGLHIGSSAVDSKCQVIVHAEAFGLNQEKAVLKPMLEGIRENFEDSGIDSGLIGPQYRANNDDCSSCAYKSKCLQGSETQPRTVCIFTHRDPDTPMTYTQKMIDKFDTDSGRFMYSRRMGIIEPVFGNIRNSYKFDWFTLRTRAKIDIQWKLISIVHNIGKLFKYSEGLALKSV